MTRDPAMVEIVQYSLYLLTWKIDVQKLLKRSYFRLGSGV